MKFFFSLYRRSWKKDGGWCVSNLSLCGGSRVLYNPRSLVLLVIHCNTLQHTAPHCNTSCNTLQHTETHSVCDSTTHCNIFCVWRATSVLPPSILDSAGTHFTLLRTATATHTATHCSKMHHTAIHSVREGPRMLYLLRALILWILSLFISLSLKRLCNALQHTATHYSTRQHTETHGNTLQHTATHSYRGLLLIFRRKCEWGSI